MSPVTMLMVAAAALITGHALVGTTRAPEHILMVPVGALAGLVSSQAMSAMPAYANEKMDRRTSARRHL